MGGQPIETALHYFLNYLHELFILSDLSITSFFSVEWETLLLDKRQIKLRGLCFRQSGCSADAGLISGRREHN